MTGHGFIWCPHCGKPHGLEQEYCGDTGAPLHAFTRSAQRSREPLIGTTIGNYHILKRIGGGGMGQVFEAENIRLRRRVAVKVVSPQRRADNDAIERFRREWKALASIQHPNICDVHDVGTMPDGMPYLVLERLTGETLEQLLQRKKRVTVERAVEMFSQILSGLDAAHRAGIIHRDLKPSNIFLVGRAGCDELVKVLDFGFAKMTSATNDRVLTRPGHACGTPEYMSPEQLRTKDLDPRSDLFSVGIMLFEVLTGSHPFAASTSTELTINIVRSPHRDIRTLRPGFSDELAAVIDRALAKSREARFATALEMQAALLDCLPEDVAAESVSSEAIPRLWTQSSPTPTIT